MDYSLSHLSDPVLLRGLEASLGRERGATAVVLAHLAEVDARKLYLPAAYPSMFAYCVGELGMSEQAALKRIRAARTAREHPAIYDAVAEGRLKLGVVLMLRPHLTAETAGELLSAAAHKTEAEVARLVAERFPRPDLPTRIDSVTPAELSARTVGAELSVRTVGAPAPPSRLAPLARERFALQVTLGQSTHDKLRRLQELMSHQVRPRDLAGVLDRALELAIAHFEKRRLAATDRPRPGRRSRNPRHIPAAVKRAVWKRDGGRCTFTSDSGRRCQARERLELDHVREVARGGPSTAGNLRLRCRAHNQHAAERAFGAGFMARKREEAGLASAARAGSAADRAGVRARIEEVIPWLRALGCGADEARRAASRCEAIPDAPLEERVRLAVSGLGPRALRAGPTNHAAKAP